MPSKLCSCLTVCFVAVFAGCHHSPSLVEPIRTMARLEEYRQNGVLPETIERIYCSGGTLRLIVYLEAADRVVAVDSNERASILRGGMKAYLMAHPEFHEKPIAGETSGRDNPELLLSLPEPPQLIIKADTGAGYDPVELTRRTGIPVLLVPMRGITIGREEFDVGLRLMGRALGKEKRAEDVIGFFDREIAEIKTRTKKAEVPERSKPTVYVGGVSYNGSHGFHSTEAGYPPFVIAGARDFIETNADQPSLGKRHTMLAKEKILEWNPDILFLDLGTLYLGETSGRVEIQHDPAYQSLTAVSTGRVYTLLPNTFYFVNHDAVLANAWFVAKTLYPEEFVDIDPKEKADEIFTFLVGKPVFEKLDAALENIALRRLEIYP